ncbi:MAG: arsenosugar biosynthesis radical SAM protein ArsS [Candidatus Omnitrophica bacterium]|nr:arsenosugar biosynthesis radical SAM protein ArsS [Candidatus Omnitrophota bacterium]
MNNFSNVLEDITGDRALRREDLTTLQVNLGNLCNQSCRHCHIKASPLGRRIMQRNTIDDIIAFLCFNKVKTLDITGGAPELNPYFDYFVKSARNLVAELIVRSNLTVFFEPGKSYLPEFFKNYKIHLICSLPCYTQKNVDSQRGEGVFKKSIKALKLLNETGFSKDNGLLLDLVYNPGGAYLPSRQDKLENDYKENLYKNYGINFNRLVTITNVAINRFKEQLKANNEYEKYLKVLEDNFNPENIQRLMCRYFLSVDFKGYLYDCDFNLALGLFLKGIGGEPLALNNLDRLQFAKTGIITGKHCLACVAGCGSSCQGALTAECADKNDI